MTLYQNMSKQGNESPRCPHCGASDWVATRPSQIDRQRHPQERKSWLERAAGVFLVSLVGSGTIGVIIIAGFTSIPGWLIWSLGSLAMALMLCAVVAVDGMAVEAKSCAIACAQCGESFIAPWRPND